MMTPSLLSVFHLVLLCTLVSIHAKVYPSMISAPDKSIKAFIGDTVSFRWHYNSGDLKNDLFEVVFGTSESPGFLKTKLIVVNSSGFASTRSSYKSSVGWAGNLTSSIAVFELYNVKLEDGKTYGLVVEYGLQYTPLTGSVQLQVESRHTGPPETATPPQRNVTTAARATNTGSPDTSKESIVAVPKKLSEESFFKLVVSSGIILCVAITLGFGYWFHRKRNKCVADNFKSNRRKVFCVSVLGGSCYENSKV